MAEASLKTKTPWEIHAMISQPRIDVFNKMFDIKWIWKKKSEWKWERDSRKTLILTAIFLCCLGGINKIVEGWSECSVVNLSLFWRPVIGL